MTEADREEEIHDNRQDLTARFRSWTGRTARLHQIGVFRIYDGQIVVLLLSSLDQSSSSHVKYQCNAAW